MHFVNLKTFFIKLITLAIFLLYSKNINAQSDIIQVKNDCVISAEASNLFPALNEPVTIKIKIKAPFSSPKGTFSLGFAWDRRAKIISKERGFREDIIEGQIITLELILKFPVKGSFYVSLNLDFVGKNRLVELEFYAGGGFRESAELSALKDKIYQQKLLLKQFQSSNGTKTPELIVVKYVDTLKGNHTIEPKNNYEKQNLELLQQQNKKEYIKCLIEYDSLRIEGLKLYNQKFDEELNKTHNKGTEPGWVKDRRK